MKTDMNQFILQNAKYITMKENNAKINSKLSYICKICMQTIHVNTIPVIESYNFVKYLKSLTLSTLFKKICSLII